MISILKTRLVGAILITGSLVVGPISFGHGASGGLASQKYRPLFGEGLNHFAKKEFGKAIIALEKALEKKDTGEAHYLIGASYFYLKEYGPSKKHLETVLKSDDASTKVKEKAEELLLSIKSSKKEDGGTISRGFGERAVGIITPKPERPNSGGRTILERGLGTIK